jgi:hypothetical protein
MSSILKAMRKIEQDQRNQQTGLPDLRLDQGQSPAEKNTLRPLIGGMLLGAGVVGGILLLVFAVSRFQQPPKTAVVAENRQAVSPAIPKDNNPSPGDTQPRTLPQHTAQPVAAPEPTVAPKPTVAPVNPKKVIPPRPAKRVDVVKPAVVEPRPVTRPRPVTEGNMAQQQTASVQASQVPLARTLPKGISLVVTQIFPQPDPVNSMAVVNDLPVMIGTQIDGAVVKDILPDRVLFQIGDTDYSVAISGSR